MKRSFFRAAVASILLYGCTTWTLTKRQEKKLDGNYTRMLWAILNKSWLQHPTSHQLYGHLPPITKTIQVRRTRHAGHCWRSRDELISYILSGPPHMAVQKQDDQHKHTFSNYVRIRDVVQKTCRRRWTIGRIGERRSGISVLSARHDDDDEYKWDPIFQRVVPLCNVYGLHSLTPGKKRIHRIHVKINMEWLRNILTVILYTGTSVCKIIYSYIYIYIYSHPKRECLVVS